ncbi:Tricalbin-2 [Ophidiomyces ophidiicola]|nr:Tricalbin-2 [Ophidiomyces ophidiicola]KAI1995090.1 Tricalbin-2 [Ophidiomyces ophidiicola]KAI1995240.1 Tricalbin-2 [Ophidiomyces ophidiicola]KAI1999072.1 Tricalbin-2 [Ophidiomyces ophidiicola]
MALAVEKNGALPSEVKQEAIIEAAQDPQSGIPAEVAEKALVAESKKAGAAVYQFDPNATPEQKKQQVENSVPAGFHRDKKPPAVAITTDIVNGTTTTNGKVPVKESPVNGQAVELASPQKPSVELTEEQRWARDRTGWAPRFHSEDDDADDGEILLDHQTALEGKLDEKFFGDWYHNAGIIIFACLTSWFVALIGGGLGWVFIVMAACGTYYRTSIRRTRRNFRDDINRELAKNRLETDTESLEWINSFLVKFWPIYAPVICDTIINSVDQVLSTATPSFLDSLRLKTFILGTKPPRLEHVKTYPKTEVDTVLMDWKFSFTPNDTMDLTARQLRNKINPKVVLEVRIGKGLVSKGLDVIVEDFAFSGLMRVKCKLQIPFPHIERVDISFMGEPEIDYVCKPLGGDLLGFDINIIPGLESFIKDQIHSNLAPMMYDPNVFPIEIAKMLAGNPIDQAVGVVAVTIHSAHNLKNSDKFSGSPDPYAVASINGRTPLGRTKTITQTTNPKWNETIYVIITSFADSLTLQIFDYNEIRRDKELGTATFPMEVLESVHEHANLSLDIMANGRHRGTVQADINFFPVMMGGKNPETGVEEPPPELNTGIAKITIEQAKELDGSRSLIGQLNPYGVLLLNGKEIHITNKLKRTNNPIFTNPSKEVLITDRKSARVGLIIKDDRDLATDPILGTYQMKLTDMLSSMEKGREWFNLNAAKTGRAKMKLEWKPVALKGVVGSGGYVTPIGVMRIHLRGAKDLRNLETMGKSDPYVRVLLSGVEKARTVTWRNNLNPDWDEVVYIPMHSAREKIILEVMDEESLGKDRSLGMLELSAANYMHEGEDGQFAVDDEKQLLYTQLRLEGRGQPKGTLNYTVAFYPTLNVIDPEEEEAEAEARKAMEGQVAIEPKKSMDSTRPSTLASPTEPKKSMESARSPTVASPTEPKKSIDSTPPSKVASPTVPNADVKANGRPSIESTGSKLLADKAGLESPVEKSAPKIRLTPQDIHKYESGLIVFKIIEGQLAHTDVQLEVVMDDYAFPCYTSSKARSKHITFNDVGDAFVRELEFSKITLRLVEKTDKKGGDDDHDHSIARLSGPTLGTLEQCLYKPTELTLKSSDGGVNKVTVSLKYIPVKMTLDPSESINNMGNLRVDVLDAADLPSADRNGFSDPYCKFKLNGKDVFKTKVQKKTLHPAWNEWFESPIPSRIAADFKVDVYDWDFGEKADYLGGAVIPLDKLDPFRSQEISIPLDGKSGAIRLKLLFKPDYIIRSRHGSSTFSGTFATPGKIVGAPVKTVGMIGGGVVKGASFLKQGLMRVRNTGKEDDISSDMGTSRNGSPAPPNVEVTPSPGRAPALAEGSPSPSVSPSPQAHGRSRSSISQAGDRLGVGAKGDSGMATVTIVSSSGYPPSTNVRVTIKQSTPKGWKEIHKSKSHKASSSGSSSPGGPAVVTFDQAHETVRIKDVSADAQFQLQVKDHATFGSDQVLGEGIFFLDDQGSSAGKERSVKVGSGIVSIKTAFTPADNVSLRPGTAYSNAVGEDPDSPDSRKVRRSFLTKR